MATRLERLAEFQTRLAAAPAARSFDEAYGQITRLMNEVEDEISGTPYNIFASPADGRLYPPLWDNIGCAQARPLVRRLVSKGHITFVGDNGGIEIVVRATGMAIFAKPGADGRRVADL